MTLWSRALVAADAIEPGAVISIYDGTLHIEARGFADAERTIALAPDAIFRISSLSKPITALALILALEDHGIDPDAPVASWFPELGMPRVLLDPAGELDRTEPARRAITVEDLLTSRMGTGIILAPPGSTPIQREIESRGLVGFGPPDPAAPMDGESWIAQLGELPLLAHPGERWFYSVSSNVQGVLVSRLSGMALSDFLAERIFEPLGMVDTGFSVPPSKRARLTPAYSSALTLTDAAATGAWSRPPSFEAGEGGLVSTAADYMTFVRMLAGERRLVSDRWIAAMLTDHLDDNQRAHAAMFLEGRGWGYGLSVDAGRTSSEAMAGTIGWSGGLGASWTSDLARGIDVLSLSSRALDDPEVYGGHLAVQRAALG